MLLKRDPRATCSEGLSRELVPPGLHCQRLAIQELSSLQSQSKGVWLLLELVEDLDLIYEVLILWACRMQALWVHGCFHSDFRKSSGRPGSVPKREVSIVVSEARSAVETQEVGEARNVDCLLMKAIRSEQSHPKGDSMRATTGNATGAGLPKIFGSLHLATICPRVLEVNYKI